MLNSPFVTFLHDRRNDRASAACNSHRPSGQVDADAGCCTEDHSCICRYREEDPASFFHPHPPRRHYYPGNLKTSTLARRSCRKAVVDPNTYDLPLSETILPVYIYQGWAWLYRLL